MLDANDSDPSKLATRLVEAGFGLPQLEEEKVNLETAFMWLTKGLGRRPVVLWSEYVVRS